MKKIFGLILYFTSIFTSLTAQEAKQLFIDMPDSILPTLTKINREDCIDFLASNMKAQVKNRFDKQSEMTKLTTDYISMQLSEISSFEMKLLPINDSIQIICTVQTVCSEACDSHIKFYTNQWESLKSSDYLSLPGKTDFIRDVISVHDTDTSNKKREELYKEADMLLMHATLSDSLNILTFRYTTPQYMSKESAERLSPFIKKNEILYEWANGKFIRKE